MRPQDKDSIPVVSLKQRMIRSEPAERAMSTSPAGTWLDGLRASFEPEGRRPSEPKPSAR